MSSRKGKISINVNDIVDKRLGKLRVISYEGYRYDITRGGEKMRHYYKVHCECGKEKIMQRGNLQSKTVYNCGCERRKRH